MSKCVSKREVLIELRKKLSPEDFKIARTSFDNIAELFQEEEKLGDEQKLPSSIEVAQEKAADEYARRKDQLIADINREEPKIAHAKSTSDAHIVPVTIKRIEGRTAYYTFKDSDKEYKLENVSSKNVSLKDKSINSMIREFAENTDTSVPIARPNQVLSKEQLDIIKQKHNECK